MYAYTYINWHETHETYILEKSATKDSYKKDLQKRLPKRPECHKPHSDNIEKD